MAVASVGSEMKSGLNSQAILGILIAVLGILMLAYPMVAAAAVAATLGWILLIVAVLQVVSAFAAPSAGSVVLRVLSGVLFGVAGFVLLVHPVVGAASLTVLLGSVLLVRAVVELASAFQLRPTTGWGWLLADGAITLLLGGMILASWPASTVWAIGTLLGISVLMSGITRVMLALSAKRLVAAV